MSSIVLLEWCEYGWNVTRDIKPKEGTIVLGAWFNKYDQLNYSATFLYANQTFRNKQGDPEPPYWIYVPARNSGMETEK